MLGLNANCIANKGTDIFGASFPVYFEGWVVSGQSSLPTMMVAIFIKIFGNNLLAIKLPLMLISIVGLVYLYRLCKLMFDEKIAFIILCLATINPWLLLQQSISLDCNYFPHIFIIALFYLYKGITKNKELLIYLSMVIFGLSLYCYGVAIFVIPLFLLLVCVMALKREDISVKTAMITMIVFIFIACPIIRFYVVNALKQEGVKYFNLLSIQRFYYQRRSDDLIFFSKNPFVQLFKNAFFAIWVSFVQSDKLPWNYITGFGTMYALPFIVFFPFGIKKIFKDKNYYLISYSICSAFLGLIVNGININRINYIWYLFIIINGVGILEVINKVKWENTKKVIMGIYALVFVLFIICFFTIYPKNVNNSFTVSKGLYEACNYIEDKQYKNIGVSKACMDNDAEYVFMLYALADGFDGNLSRQRFIEIDMNLDDEDFCWLGEKINISSDISKLDNEDVYLILDNEYTDEYKNKYSCIKFNKYYVLIKNS